MLTRWSWLILLGSLTMAPAAHAQLPVIDAANLTQNTISAVQAVLMVANQIIDLTALDALVLDDVGFWEDLGALQDLATNAQGLAWDLGSLQLQLASLFALETAPNNTRDLQRSIQEIRGYIWQAHAYAMRTQTLLTTAIRTVNHIIGVYTAVQHLIGNLQGAQAAGQAQTKLVQVLTNMQTQEAAFQRAASIEGISAPFVQQSLDNIEQQLLSDYPRR